MRAQVAARGIGILIGLQGSINPLRGSATYRPAGATSRSAERAAWLAEPEVRGAGARRAGGAAGGACWLPLDRIFELGDPPDYEPEPSPSIAARAAGAGAGRRAALRPAPRPAGARRCCTCPVLNYFDGNLDAAAEMLAHPHAVPGLGDGGAHVGTICDASFPTTLLTHWGRDRTRGERFDVPVGRPAAVPGHGRDGRPARPRRAGAGLQGRPQRHRLRPPPPRAADASSTTCRPAASACCRQATGYLHTIVSGTETYRDGEPTGDLPGRLVRGPQAEPGNPG